MILYLDSSVIFFPQLKFTSDGVRRFYNTAHCITGTDAIFSAHLHYFDHDENQFFPPPLL